MKTLFSFMFAVGVLTLAGCTPVEKTDTMTNDTWRLDEVARRDAPSAEFAHRVEQFYQAIQKKDWPTTYDMRTSDFKQDMTRDAYLKNMATGGETLTSYKVLNLRRYSDVGGGATAAEMIMEFNEAGVVSYNSVRWIRQDGKWLCAEPGLSAPLSSLRAPDWMPK